MATDDQIDGSYQIGLEAFIAERNALAKTSRHAALEVAAQAQPARVGGEPDLLARSARSSIGSCRRAEALARRASPRARRAGRRPPAPPKRRIATPSATAARRRAQGPGDGRPSGHARDGRSGDPHVGGAALAGSRPGGSFVPDRRLWPVFDGASTVRAARRRRAPPLRVVSSRDIRDPAAGGSAAVRARSRRGDDAGLTQRLARQMRRPARRLQRRVPRARRDAEQRRSRRRRAAEQARRHWPAVTATLNAPTPRTVARQAAPPERSPARARRRGAERFNRLRPHAGAGAVARGDRPAGRGRFALH